MGTLYVVVPSDPELRAWLRESDLPVPDDADGRLPTNDEIRAALSTLRDYTIEFRDEEREHVAEISFSGDPQAGPWASFSFPKSRDLTPEEESLTFRRGSSEVMIPVLLELSRSSGPLALIPDSGADPLLVWSGANVAELIETFGG
jgi:hypothetical protein